MAKWAVIFGVGLVLLGLVGYFGADPNSMESSAASIPAVGETSQSVAKAPAKKGTSKTALIPAVVGLALMLCGTLGFDSKMKKHALHGAAAVGLLGFVLSLVPISMKMGSIMAGDPIKKGTWFSIGMSILCLLYVIMSINSFIAARKSRERGGVSV